MVENVALGNLSAAIHPAEKTCIDDACDRLLPDDPSRRPKFSFAATETESTNSCAAATIDPRSATTDSIARRAASKKLDIDGSTEERVYSDSFLKSCGELASYTDSICERKDCATTWLSRVRTRCSNVRDWLTKMCSCLEGGTAFISQSVGSYQRLGAKTNLFEFRRRTSKPRAMFPEQGEDRCEEEEQIAELRFHCDDLTSYSMIVEKNLRTIDLCELLRVKKSMARAGWSIVETWPDLGIERTLEDHEDILAVHREMKCFATKRVRQFFYRQDYLKYEFFVDPGQFFPVEMIAVPAVFAVDRRRQTAVEDALRSRMDEEEIECPQVFSLVWIRIGRLNAWRRTHMLLRDRKLYLAKKGTGQVTPFAGLSDYALYKITNAKRSFRAPFPWGICLRISGSAEAESTVFGGSGLKVIAFHSEKSRACWLTAMRLAKYGKQLRENYRAFKNKQCEQSDNPKERYVNYNVSNESARSRVAMDFTGSVGRIVEDPKEAKNIAESEGVNWRRTWRPFSRPPPGCAVVRLHGLDDGIHVLQPWFHRGLKRDIAAAIVRDHGSVDGVFLVRESKSNLGAYVLTYKYSEKVFHAQIQPVFDERCNCWLYTLDKGITRFYDLLQLIEFYQLNAGCLPTRLTHYVQSGVPAALPLSTQEDGGASPLPAELAPRYTGAPSVSVAYATSTGAGHRSI